MEKEFINIHFDEKRFLTSCKVVYRYQLLRDKSIIGGFRVLILIGITSLCILQFLSHHVLYCLGIIGLLFFISIVILVIIGNIQTSNEFRQNYSKVINGFDLNMRFLYDQEFVELYSFNDVNNTFDQKWSSVTDAILIKRTNTLILNMNDGNRIFVIPSKEDFKKLKNLVMFIDQKNIKVLEV